MIFLPNNKITYVFFQQNKLFQHLMYYSMHIFALIKAQYTYLIRTNQNSGIPLCRFCHFVCFRLDTGNSAKDCNHAKMHLFNSVIPVATYHSVIPVRILHWLMLVLSVAITIYYSRFTPLFLSTSFVACIYPCVQYAHTPTALVQLLP